MNLQTEGDDGDDGDGVHWAEEALSFPDYLHSHPFKSHFFQSSQLRHVHTEQAKKRLQNFPFPPSLNDFYPLQAGGEVAAQNKSRRFNVILKVLSL